MARVEEARRGALGRLLALEPRPRGGHRVAALLDRRADRLELAAAPARGRPPPTPARRRRARSRSRPSPPRATPGIWTSRSSARISSPSSITSSRTLSWTSSNCCACSRRSLRVRVVTSSPIPPHDQRQERERDEAGDAAARVAGRGSRARPQVADAVGEVEQDRVDVAGLRLERGVGRLRGGALAELGAARAERPPGHEHVGPRPADPLLERRAAPPRPIRRPRAPRSRGRNATYIGPASLSVMRCRSSVGLASVSFGVRVRVDVDRVARERLRGGVEQPLLGPRGGRQRGGRGRR